MTLAEKVIGAACRERVVGAEEKGGGLMNAGDVERALRKHIGWHQCTMIPECEIANYRADFVQISVAGYLTEFEVKVSRSDWRADLKKAKWEAMPPWVTRFIYVVPVELGIPDFVPSFAGVWHVAFNQKAGLNNIEIARAPKRIGKEKVPANIVERWMRSFYYRYWHMRIDIDRRQTEAACGAPASRNSEVRA